MNNDNVLIAIPAYNEELNIEKVVLSSLRYGRVLVIDDGSTDRTAAVAESCGANVLKHNVNKGKGIAINTAFKYARSSSVSILVLIDGDGQHDPHDIPRLVKVISDGADMVVGSRYLGNNQKSIPFYRMIGQNILTYCSNLGSGIYLTDSQNGFRAFSKRAIKVLSFNMSGFSVESEMQFRAKENKLIVREVPIKVDYSSEVKRSPVVHGVSVLISVIKMSLKRKFKKEVRFDENINDSVGV
ncbi:glycosyltransferase family 2 protein [Pelotomaculum propionicicum]|uniref:Bifunctional apolipoprotein N-acyltransferase/polyprenol monophosphomannose synthase n=1 Tax=Pelotomaculum propionicicum TaxID=258475 RepID=A0A4Y7RQE1_9FIRM|nr:glycosyltransferase family 2 protein [Pelotomaculum propionicicum]TEB11063.1 Bifunctional apolipoprotein N-acyltransferase/polyprenol monophosphomannose synthase [Pelotomaculum propionicicum]